jgi:pilus assembly protein Flp/PilA
LGSVFSIASEILLAPRSPATWLRVDFAGTVGVRKNGKEGEVVMRAFQMVRMIASWGAARLDVRSDRGATAVEYGIMVALIAAVIIVAVVFLGKKTSSTFSCTASNIDAGSAGTGC